VFDAGTRLALVDADGGNLTLLPAQTPDDGDPTFAPDGRRIAFAVPGTGIDVVELDEGERNTIVPLSVFVSSLEWSPEGDKLAYIVDDDENETVFELHVADADGSHRRLVSKSGDAVRSFDWRPAAPSE
jgi:Tol biopolymer transport system component